MSRATTVRMEPRLLTELAKVAEKCGVAPAQIIRWCVHNCLPILRQKIEAGEPIGQVVRATSTRKTKKTGP